MRKRSYIFLGIIVVCLLLLGLSLTGSLETTSYVKREEQPMLKQIMDESSKNKQKGTLDYNPKDVSQEIFGLYLPSYDENGQEVSVIRGAYTIFLRNRIYRITNPEIEFAGLSDGGENKPKNIIITSDFGEIDKITKEAFLYENVVTRLENGVQIFTDDLKYQNEDKTVYTNGFVTVKGEGMKITGSGFEVSMLDSKVRIKNDPEMELKSTGTILFSDSKNTTAEPQSSETRASGNNLSENLFIRSTDELVFEYKNKLATFYDNVRISKGKSTIFCDKLSIFFTSGIQDVDRLIASGNVLASDGEKTAKGESLSWNTTDQVAVLDDDPFAEFFNNSLTISAAKIKFFKEQSKMEVPVSGQLTTTAKKQEPKSNDQKEKSGLPTFPGQELGMESIIITWKGKMLFNQETNQAVFEKEVVVNKESTKLYCDKLVITHDEEGTLKNLVATHNVHLIEKQDDSRREAKGDKMIWTAQGNYTELYGTPLASVVDDEKDLSAPKILFSQNDKKMLAEGKGELIIKTRTEKDEDTGPVQIKWEDKMTYDGITKTAIFYGFVKATKGNEKLDCDKLDVFFYDKDKIKKLVASDNVYIASPDLENSSGVGSLLVWDFSINVAVLTGDPLAELRRSGVRTFSKKVYFDINTKRVHWEGKPHWLVYE
ncbi:MAG: LPS export ABC transporter periplasmic protein LptC [Candidatus Scalindua sp.]|nr:LPS export ABC transporter periplasmic protein LptC [Candidatus Scalindua sp.]